MSWKFNIQLAPRSLARWDIQFYWEEELRTVFMSRWPGKYNSWQEGPEKIPAQPEFELGRSQEVPPDPNRD